jgi:hypothetical protein
MDSIYLEMQPNGLCFAPVMDAKSSLFSARRRMQMAGDENSRPLVSEPEQSRLNEPT